MRQLNIKFKKLDLNSKCNKRCQDFIEKMDKVKGKVGGRILKSIFITPIEKRFIEGFCDENNTDISNLLKAAFFFDGAIPEELVLAIHNSPRGVVDFIHLDPAKFSYNYLKEYENMSVEDFEEAFNEKGVSRPIWNRAEVAKAIEEHRIALGYPTFAIYAKQALYDLGVYPALAIGVAKSHSRVIPEDLVLTPAQVKFKMKRREKAAKEKKRADADLEAGVGSVKLSLSTFSYEQTIVKKFTDALKEQGLNIGTLVKYRMREMKIINDSMIKGISYEDEQKIKDFHYECPTAEGDWAFYENEKKKAFGVDRKVKTFSFTREAKDVIFKHKKIGKGRFGVFIRKEVLDHYGAYPKVNGVSVVKIFSKK